jgi:hypothetical protein
MSWLITLGGLVAVGYGLFWVTQKTVVIPGRALRSKFQAAGVLRGCTKADIIAKVGPAQSVSNFADGTSLLQWMATGYHICLGFDQKNVCTGVQSEYTDRDMGTG